MHLSGDLTCPPGTFPVSGLASPQVTHSLHSLWTTAHFYQHTFGNLPLVNCMSKSTPQNSEALKLNSTCAEENLTSIEMHFTLRSLLLEKFGCFYSFTLAFSLMQTNANYQIFNGNFNLSFGSIDHFCTCSCLGTWRYRFYANSADNLTNCVSWGEAVFQLSRVVLILYNMSPIQGWANTITYMKAIKKWTTVLWTTTNYSQSALGVFGN